MPDVVLLLIAASGTALATGIGAVPVFFLGDRAAQLTPLLLGFAAGVMGVASIAGLLIPAGEEGSALAVIGGLAVGASLLGVVRWKLSPRATFMGHADSGARTSALVFLVLFVHSLPEGFAIGTAFASDRAGLSLFVILAIAVQNIPEGTSVGDPDGGVGLLPRPPVLGRGGDQRAAADRRPDRLPPGRADRIAAALLLRLRRRGDAGPDRGRAAAAGLLPGGRGSGRAPASRSAPRSCSG